MHCQRAAPIQVSVIRAQQARQAHAEPAAEGSSRGSPVTQEPADGASASADDERPAQRSHHDHDTCDTDNADSPAAEASTMDTQAHRLRTRHSVGASQQCSPVAKSQPAGEQVNTASDIRMEVEEAEAEARAATQTRRPPQRKASVFSFDGFPNIQLLDQQNLKARSLSQQEPSNLVAARAGSASFLASQASPPGQLAGPREADKAHRPARSDTLGSTGSSRASSCDEPTITTLSLSASSAGSLGPPLVATKTPAPRAAMATSEPVVPARKLSASGVRHLKASASSASNSSLDSVGWPAASEPPGKSAKCCDEDAASRHHQHQPAKLAPTARLPVIPPFESIKVRLKHNSMPNAQLIQRHIDNLISQNEAIIDNCNLVSIRSYNSSREYSAAQTTSSQQLVQPSVATTPVAKTPGQEPAVSQARSKRWSSTVLASPTADRSLSAVSLGSSQDSSPEPANCDSNSVSQKAPAQQPSRQLKLRQLERKRSYNLSQRTPVSSHRLDGSSASLLLSSDTEISVDTGPARPISLAPDATREPNSSTSAPTSPKPTGGSSSLALDTQRFLFGSAARLPAASPADHQQPMDVRNPFRKSQDPMQLESAIQNLSLKRKDSEMQTLSSGNHTNENHISTRHQLQQQQQQQQDALSSSKQNLTLKRDEQLVMAALLMEKHRQLLIEQQQHQMNLDSQAAMIRLQQQQQQVIDQQLEQIRLRQLAASMGSQQHGQRRQSEQQMNITAVASSVPAILLHMSQPAATNLIQQQQQQQQQQQNDDSHLFVANSGTNYLREQQAIESQLLRDFLAKMMPLEEQEDGSIIMEQSGELLTQSLDSATPMYRCDTCDIAFWTRDLLNYHSITQCLARGREPQQSARPLAFNFVGPNNFEQQQPVHHYNQLSKSVSPPRRYQLNDRGEQQRRSSCLKPVVGSIHACAAADALWAQQQSSYISILRQQLLTLPPDPVVVPHESLPFKKRKISEPNMRY